jgi:hypothetical protein
LDRGMKALLTFLILALFASSVFAKKLPGLKVKGNYKELLALVEEVPKNDAGLTREDVQRAVKLRLLANGIKTPGSLGPHYLYVRVGMLSDGRAFKIDVFLVKTSSAYGVDAKVAGSTFTPDVQSYGTLGSAGKDKQYVLGALNGLLDDFLLDYLETNID